MAAPHEPRSDSPPAAAQEPAPGELLASHPATPETSGAAEILAQLDTALTESFPWDARLTSRLDNIPPGYTTSGAQALLDGFQAATLLSKGARGQKEPIDTLFAFGNEDTATRLTYPNGKPIQSDIAYCILPATALAAIEFDLERRDTTDWTLINERIRTACAEIASDTYRPPKMRRPAPNSLGRNAQAALHDWYRSKLSSREAADKFEPLTLLYFDPQTGSQDYQSMVADMQAAGYRVPDTAADLERLAQLLDAKPTSTDKAAWAEDKSRLDSEVVRHRITKVLIDALASGQATFCELSVLASGLVKPPAEKPAALPETPDDERLHSLTWISEQLGLSVRDATSDMLLELEHNDEGEQEPRETEPSSHQPRPLDPFRVLTLARLHQEIPGSRLIFKFRDPTRAAFYDRPDAPPVSLDEIFGTVVLLTPEGNAVVENLYGGATLVWRHETGQGFDPIVTWDDLKHDRRLVRAIGGVRNKHPYQRDMILDYGGTLEQYVALILKDLRTPLKPGEELRSYKILQTVRALGGVAILNILGDQ